MTQNLDREYNEACDNLITELPALTNLVFVSKALATVDIYQDYNHRYEPPAMGQTEVNLLIFANSSKNGALAVMPVALYAEGQVLASATFGGSLAELLQRDYHEILLLRGGRWVCLGSKAIQTGRFPTIEFSTAVANALNG